MDPILLIAAEENKNIRLDAFLASSLDALSRSAAVKLIESGAVTVNGKSVAKNYKLLGTERIEALCDAFCRTMAETLPDSPLTARFSPGYGDLPLTLQEDISYIPF